MSSPTEQQSGNPVTRYFRGAFEELRRVTWPTRIQAINMTIVVIIISLAAAVLIAVIDYVLTLGYNTLVEMQISTPISTDGTELPSDFELPADDGTFDFSNVESDESNE